MKPKSNSVLERKEPSSNVLLPNALATRILDLELELQSATVTKEQVLELLALYSEAMEFYEEHNDPKYKIFQQRIHTLLKKGNVNEVINGKAADNSSRDRPIVEGRTHAERSAKEQAKAIIKYYNVEIEKQAARVEKDIEQQKQKILERVRSRSQSKGKVVNPESESAGKDKSRQLSKEEPSNSRPMKTVFGSAFLDEISDFKLPERKTIVKRQDS